MTVVLVVVVVVMAVYNLYTLFSVHEVKSIDRTCGARQQLFMYIGAERSVHWGPAPTDRMDARRPLLIPINIGTDPPTRDTGWAPWRRVGD